ncbi:hypothetical protein PG993_003643 [Apiospora rasikravindrae]|uniref:Uncharacterized protein n=1 Tax=Apiospora rasikravindrae TaxID=990691 RepID=A0ABR1U037_9PEZI
MRVSKSTRPVHDCTQLGSEHQVSNSGGLTATTNDVTKTDSGGASATSEGSSSPASSPHSSSPTDSAESTNSTMATTTTSEAPRPITTEVVVTPTTSVPNLLSKWPNGANGKEVEFITSLLGFIIAFII